MPLARDMYSRAGWTLAFTLIMYINSRREFPGPSAVLAAVLTLIAAVFVAAGYGLTWLAGTGRVRILEQLLDAANLQGGERVLDISAGPELAIAAAKRMKSGKVISLGDPTANEVSREKAKQAGVAERVRFEAGDPQKLTYPDTNFDLVIASRGVSGDAEVAEVARVLKAGGRAILHDFSSLDTSMTSAGLKEVSTLVSSLPLGLGGRIFCAKK